MKKRFVLKVFLLVLGLCLLLFGGGSFWFFSNYDIDTDETVMVLVATRNIEKQEIVDLASFSQKEIKKSTVNDFFIQDVESILGQRSLYDIPNGEYVKGYMFSEFTYEDDLRIITTPVNFHERLANQIRRNSLIDVILFEENKKPKVVLSKISVNDILDELGNSMQRATTSGEYSLKFLLNSTQRKRFYIASELGDIGFELYLDDQQEAPYEEFIIPEEHR